jgi:hypothetical protein
MPITELLWHSDLKRCWDADERLKPELKNAAIELVVTHGKHKLSRAVSKRERIFPNCFAIGLGKLTVYYSIIDNGHMARIMDYMVE